MARGRKPANPDDRPLEPGEWPILKRMADAIRESLGLAPLFRKPRPSPHAQRLFDEVDHDWK